MLQNLLTQYVRPTEGELSKLLADCIVAFDTNILLNLYRYSESTRDDFLKLYEHSGIRSRLWLPYQAADEFMRNREIVRLGKVREIEDLEASLSAIVRAAISKCKQDIEKIERNQEHPHIDIKGLKTDLPENLLASFEQLSSKYLQAPNEQVQEHDLDNDALFQRIERLLGNQIGNGFGKSALEAIRIEGEARYKIKIPPGYEDVKNKDDPYGDLIVWKELIQYAKDQNKGVVFVTDDAKEDWILTVNKQKIGPRPELIKEMLEEAGQRFHLYNSATFYKYAKKLIKETPRPESVQEAEAVNEQLSNEAPLEMHRQNLMWGPDPMTDLQVRMDSIQRTTNPIADLQARIDASRGINAELRARIDSIQGVNMNPIADLQARIDSIRGVNPVADLQARIDSVRGVNMNPIADLQARMDAIQRVNPMAGLQAQMDSIQKAMNPDWKLQNEEPEDDDELEDD